MYTFNLFVFGHDMSIDPDLNNDIHEFDVEMSRNINSRKYEIDLPYHGGQCAGDLYSVIFGTIVTDDDHNKDYVNIIRNAKEIDYIEDYNSFLTEVKKGLIQDTEGGYGEEKFRGFVNKLIEFLDNNKPGFYTVEASS